jgi:methionine-rich copper-binding protein CopC
MQHPHRLAVVAAACLLLAVAGPAAAHEELVASDPPAGAGLDEAPAEIVLTFSGELTPESGFILFSPADDEVGTGELDLTVAERNVLRGDGVDAGDGSYTILWTGVGLDGHPQEGTITFTVGAIEQPNTALARSPLLPLLGLLLVIFALAAGLRRRRRTGST